MPDQPTTQEQPPTQGTQTGAATTTPAAAPPASYAEQYDLEAVQEATSETPEAREAPTGEATLPPQSPPPRDEKGRFLPRHEHSPVQKRLAREFGLEDEEIAQTPPEELREFLALQREELNARRMLALHERARDPATTTQPSPSPGTPPQPQDDLGLDEALYEPGLVNAFKKLAKRVEGYEAEIKALKEQLDGLSQRERFRAEETLADHADRRFAEHANVFGTTPRRKLKEGSRELVRRQAVLRAMGPIRPGDDFDAKFDAAFEALYGETPKAGNTPPGEPADERLDQRRREWQEAGLARPTQRSAPELPNGVQKARRAVREQLGRMPQEQEAPNSLDEFPG